MKNVLIKDSIKEITKTRKKFISLLLMAFLGVGFFAGIRATSPDMKKTINNYYNEKNVFDIEVLSTLGLTQEDVIALQNVKGVDKVYGTFSEDVITNIGDEEVVTKVIELKSDVNEVTLLEGRLPEAEDECVVEQAFISNMDKKIGDYIEIEENTTENSSSDEAKTNFKNTKLKIVGTVNSPLYVSRDRGTSKLGTGKVNYYIYTDSKNISTDIYTEIYLTLTNSSKIITGSEEYKKYVKKVTTNVEKIKEEREMLRYDEVKGLAENKVKDAETKLEESKMTAEKEFADAREKIATSENEIAKSEETLKSSQNEAYIKFKKADTEISNAEKELANKKSEFEISKKNALSQVEEYTNNLNTQRQNLQTVQNNLSAANTSYNQIINKLQDGSLSVSEISNLQAQKTTFENTIATLASSETTLKSAIVMLEGGITQINTSIANGEKELTNAESLLSSKKVELKSTKNTTYTKLANASKQINEAKIELDNGKTELSNKEAEYNDKIKEAENEIIEAKEKIDEIEKAKWYILR